MAAELPRPGVEVIQQFQSAAPTIVRPTLVPFVCGPAKEVIDALNADGTINTSAKQGSYTQLPKLIAQTSFPSPRGNILQVDVDESTIKAFLLFGGTLYQLPTAPGSSFLTAWNKSTQAAVQTIAVGAGFSIDQKTSVFAVDQPARLNTTADVVVTFAASSLGGTLTAAQVAAQINAAVGQTVAVVIGSGVTARVQITSPTFGAKSSITIRAGGSANVALFGTGTDAHENRVESAGFRGQDQANNTTITPWVEWSQGNYVLDGVNTSFPAIPDGTHPGYGLVDSTGTFNNSQTANITFTGGGSINLMVGDDFYADGVKPNTSAVVMKVETTRFKLGTVDTALSVYDANGNLVSAVYDPSYVGTLFNSVPFNPRYAWFKAENLVPNTVALPAVLTGNIQGAAALVAFVEGSSAPAGPFALTGLNLIVSVTVNGVVLPDQTFTFSGPALADMPAVVAAIGSNITGVAAVNDSGKLKLATTSTGQLQAITLRGTSTAAVTLGFTAGDHSATGHDVEFDDVPPNAVTSGNAGFANLGAKNLVIKLSTDGGVTFPTTRTHVFGAGPFADINAVVSDINGDAPFIVGLTVAPSGTELSVKENTGNASNVIKIDSSSNAINGVGLLAYTPNQLAQGFNQINGNFLKFSINNRPHVYQIVFTSNSIVDAVNAINAVVGVTVASIGGGGSNELVLTSDLKGAASSVNVTDGTVDTTVTQINRSLGFAGNLSAVGSGRPNPDFYIDISGNVVLGAEILRAPVTGTPFDPGQADLYIQYKGLRLDLSPRANVPGVLNVSDVTTLETILNPITSDNPLGLGMFFAMVNAPGIVVSGMGVSDANPAAPFGTLAAYTEVANFLEAQEVYAIAPLTSDETVAEMWQAHVDFMSGPEQKGERILFFNPPVPTRAVDTVVGSGLSGNSTATANQFQGDVNPASALLAAGINPALPIPVSAGVFLQVTVNGVLRTYNVSAVNGVIFTLNTTFSGTQNIDGFYTTTNLVETLVNVQWSMKVRGAPLVLAGSTLPDKDAITNTVAAKSGAYKDRRLYYVFPDTVKATVGGLEQSLPGFYACAAIAGMVAHFPPQQGFTNLPMAGFTGVVGSNDKFSNKQLNGMAGGGTYIIVQDVQGAPLVSRHQLSTDLTSIESRELSITKIVDYVAKFLRTGLRNFIGTFNITQPFLDTVSTAIHGMLKFLEENNVLISGDLNNIIQSTDQPDTVLVDVTLNVPFPCNYIRLTLVV